MGFARVAPTRVVSKVRPRQGCLCQNRPARVAPPPGLPPPGLARQGCPPGLPPPGLPHQGCPRQVAPRNWPRRLFRNCAPVCFVVLVYEGPCQSSPLLVAPARVQTYIDIYVYTSPCPCQGCPRQGCPPPGLSPRFAPTRVASARVAPARVAPARVAPPGLPPPGLPARMPQGCPRHFSYF